MQRKVTALTAKLPQLGSGRASGKILTKRRAQTRDRLVEAARELIAERGIDATSVEEISERAGYTRGAFYSNFDDIYDIFTAVSTAEFAQLEAHLESAWKELVEDARGGQIDLMETVTRLLSALGVNREFYLVQTELALQMVRHPELRQRLDAPRSSFMRRLAGFLVDAVAACGMSLKGEPEAITSMIVGLIRQAFEVSLAGGDEAREDMGSRVREIIPLFIAAVAKPA